jgi:hypothetical protein
VTNERLRQIECLYHAALEHDESEWEVFLDAACGPDEDLRQEVDSLLFYSRHSENFLESSALETVAKKLANEESCEQTWASVATFRTSAVSSTLGPPKKSNSTTRAFLGSSADNSFSASSRETMVGHRTQRRR